MNKYISLKAFSFLFLLSLSLSISLPLFTHLYLANAQGEGFSIQVSPSPLIATLEPSSTTDLEIKIRNTSTQPETLVMGVKSFTINSTSAAVELNDEPSEELSKIVSFSNPEFDIGPGQWFTQKLTVAVPEDPEFNYNFATTISRKDKKVATEGSTIEGSVAIFTLLSVNRPGAIKSYEITEFKALKRVFDYLPAKFILKIKNTGNTNVSPLGNLFINKNASDESYMETIPINPNGSFILPNSERDFELQWADGFPFRETTTNENGEQSDSLNWSLKDLSKLRIGKYNASVVALYDNGQRDVPLGAEVSFWVIPVIPIIILFLVLLLAFVGVYVILKRVFTATKKLSSNLKNDDKKTK
jgi:hypothetical protein